MIESTSKSKSKIKKKLADCRLKTCLAGRQAAYLPILLMTIILLLTHTTELHPTIRYVSHTGSSTPPYTSWETAADSIQKAIDICEPGDTVLVANGVYYEALYINKTIHLIGSSMDSTIINNSIADSLYIVYCYENNSSLENFTFMGPGKHLSAFQGIYLRRSNCVIQNCIVTDSFVGYAISSSSPHISNCIVYNTNYGIFSQCIQDNCIAHIKNNVFISQNSVSGVIVYNFGGSLIFDNNIIIEEASSRTGVRLESQRRVVFKNNLISGFNHRNVSLTSHSDTVFFINNNSMNVQQASGIYTSQGSKTVIRNNIIQNTIIGVSAANPVSSDYNLFNNVSIGVNGGAYLGDGNVFADPMFVNDTIPRPSGSYDLHLQKYSPAIDAGDPNIHDVDGSRSDIGMFGGPLGQKYTYMDLAPKPPRNLTATLDSGLVLLKWNKNTEADLYRYRVYRDTVPNFIYDTTKIVAVVADTFYYDFTPDKYSPKDFYYKLTAIDSAYNQSAASEEVHVNITGIPEAPPVVVEHYRLLQNYPNPFNPSTTIPYRLKEPGYVKVMVYNLLGELVRVLVNQWQDKGYYEVMFQPDNIERKKAEGFVEFETGYYGNIVSGIYLYRIEIIGEGSIPRFSDMKKMLMIK